MSVRDYGLIQSADSHPLDIKKQMQIIASAISTFEVLLNQSRPEYTLLICPKASSIRAKTSVETTEYQVHHSYSLRMINHTTVVEYKESCGKHPQSGTLCA